MKTAKAMKNADETQSSGQQNLLPSSNRRVLVGLNDFAHAYPELVAQWHPSKNGSLTPYSITKASNKIVWWICPKGHEWKAPVNRRADGHGCPFCCNRRVLTGYNDFAHEHPELMLEWDFDKNKEINPETIISMSEKKVWWKCKSGHSYQATVKNRTLGTGCPKCATKKQAEKVIQEHAESFLERFRKANKHFSTIQLLGEYTGVWEKIQCHCKVCGNEWETTPANLLDGCGCPRCAGVHRRTHKEFEKEFAKKNPYYKSIVLLGRFLTTKTPIECQCKECGHTWFPKPERLLQGSGCPKCMQRTNGTKRKQSHETFVTRMKTINPFVDFTSQYRGSSTPLGCRCQKCGYKWSARPDNLLKGKGCPRCAHKIPLTHKEFLERIQDNPHIGDIEFLGEYKNTNEGIPCRCRICGHEWNALPSTLYRGGGCRKCGNVKKGQKKILSREVFLSLFREKNKKYDSIEIVGDYKGGKEPILCLCKVCGHKWSPLPTNLLKGRGCPHCAHVQTSFAEQFLYWGLVCKLGEDAVLSRDRLTIGRELDIVIPNWKMAIEYGSWFWHRKRLKTDVQKSLLCKEKGFELMVVFDGFDSIGEMLERPAIDGCKMFSQDLGSEQGYGGLKSLLREILESNGENSSFSDAQWKTIEKMAIENSRLVTNEEFASALKRQNSFADKINLIGQYKGVEATILCECKECGHKWSPRAGNLLRNHGCPRCASARVGAKRRIKLEDFVRKLKRCNSRWNTMELVGPFNGTAAKLLCRCRVCGHEWMVYPLNLLKGHACPMCGKRKGESVD